MHLAKSILLVISGVITGIAFVISCGDNFHSSADAAIDAPKVTDAAPVCDCPAAEPPLTGRFVVFSQLYMVPGNDIGGGNVMCPVGMQIISGSCTPETSNANLNLTLQASGFFNNFPTAWTCSFRNNLAQPTMVRAAAICLKPNP